MKSRKYCQTICLCVRYINFHIFGFVTTFFAKVKLSCWGVSFGRQLSVKGIFRIHNSGRFKIGSGVRIRSGQSNYVGCNLRVSVWVGSKGTLEISDNCALSNCTIICVNSVRILNGTMIGGGCEIFDTDFHSLDSKHRQNGDDIIATGPIQIGPHAFLGSGCKILKNVTIGEGSVVGAGSVVTSNIPPFEIWAGVPARFIKKLPFQER